MSLTNAISVCDLNKRVVEAYTGPLFRAWSRDNGLYDAVQDGNGELDRAAYEAWRDGNEIIIARWYDQLETTDWVTSSFGDGYPAWGFDQSRGPALTDGSGNSLEDDDGNLVMSTQGSNNRFLSAIDASTDDAKAIGVGFSAFIRSSPDLQATGTSNLFGQNSGGAAAFTVRNPDDSEAADEITLNYGDPNHYVDGVLFEGTRYELYTEVNQQGWQVLGIAGATAENTAGTRLFRANLGNFTGDHTTLIVYSDDKSSTALDVSEFMEGLYSSGLQFIVKNTSGTPLQDVNVQFFEIDAFDAATPSLANIAYIGDPVVSGADGVATYEGAFDNTKVQGAFAYEFEWDAGESIYKQKNLGWGLIDTNITHTPPE